MKRLALLIAAILVAAACGGDSSGEIVETDPTSETDQGGTEQPPQDDEPAGEAEPSGDGTVLLVPGFDGIDRVDLDAESSEPFIEGLGQVGRVELVGDDLWIQAETTLTRADAESGDVAGAVALPDFPLEIVRAGDTAFVIYGIPGASSAVAVIDVANLELAGSITAPQGTTYLTIASSGESVWVFGGDIESSTTVSKLDAAALAQTTTSDVGIIADWMSGGEGAIWVGGTVPVFLSESGLPESAIAKLNPASGEVTMTIALGEPADFIVVETGFGHLWATKGLDGMLYKINPASGEIVDSVDTGDGAAGIPLEIIFTADVVWVFNTTEDVLVGYDPDTLEFVEGINVPPFSGAPVFAP